MGVEKEKRQQGNLAQATLITAGPERQVQIAKHPLRELLEQLKKK